MREFFPLPRGNYTQDKQTAKCHEAQSTNLRVKQKRGGLIWVNWSQSGFMTDQTDSPVNTY